MKEEDKTYQCCDYGRGVQCLCKTDSQCNDKKARDLQVSTKAALMDCKRALMKSGGDIYLATSIIVNEQHERKNKSSFITPK